MSDEDLPDRGGNGRLPRPGAVPDRNRGSGRLSVLRSQLRPALRARHRLLTGRRRCSSQQALQDKGSGKMTSANMPISDAKALELQRILVPQEMQDEIISWAKKRFAMLGLAAAVLGFFGLSTVLNQSLQILVTERKSTRLHSRH